jgi:hypothetical protein
MVGVLWIVKLAMLGAIARLSLSEQFRLNALAWAGIYAALSMLLRLYPGNSMWNIVGYTVASFLWAFSFFQSLDMTRNTRYMWLVVLIGLVVVPLM